MKFRIASGGLYFVFSGRDMQPVWIRAIQPKPMKPRCLNIWLAVWKGPALFSFFSWEGYSFTVSLTLTHTSAHTPFSKFAISPPPIVFWGGSFCLHYLSPLMCMCRTFFWAHKAPGWLPPHLQLHISRRCTKRPRVRHSRWHYLNSLPPQDYAMATKPASADWRWEKRKL